MTDASTTGEVTVSSPPTVVLKRQPMGFGVGLGAVVAIIAVVLGFAGCGGGGGSNTTTTATTTLSYKDGQAVGNQLFLGIPNEVGGAAALPPESTSANAQQVLCNPDMSQYGYEVPAGDNADQFQAGCEAAVATDYFDYQHPGAS